LEYKVLPILLGVFEMVDGSIVFFFFDFLLFGKTADGLFLHLGVKLAGEDVVGSVCGTATTIMGDIEPHQPPTRMPHTLYYFCLVQKHNSPPTRVGKLPYRSTNFCY
jgi:hypothetical protein